MTRARELADLLTGGQTITTADNTAQLTLSSTDADANVGPLLVMMRDSSSPADNDILSRIDFKGDNDAGEETFFGSINAIATDVSDGTEDAQIKHRLMVGGAVSNVFELNSSEIIFNEDSKDIDFRVESNGNANMLVVDAGNDRIGIGTSSPLSALHVDAAIDASPAAKGVHIGMSNNYAAMEMSGSDGGFIDFQDATDGSDHSGRIIYGHSDDKMIFSTAGVQRLAIDSSGNVGIGTTSASFGTTSSAGLEISHATRGIIRLEGNSAAQALELYGDSTGGTIDARGSGAVLQFDLGGSEKARIVGTEFLVGMTTANGLGGKSDVNGVEVGPGYININRDDTATVNAITFGKNNSVVGSISTTGSSTAYNTSSDRRLKSNIEDATSASDKIDAIQVRQFDWNVDGHHQDYGLIAQELQPIEPMAVTGDADSDEMMAVDYSKLVPMLIKEIQELRSRVATLEAS